MERLLFSFTIGVFILCREVDYFSLVRKIKGREIRDE